MRKKNKLSGAGEGNGFTRRRKILLFIHEFKERNDYSPNIREIGLAVGVTSTSMVNYYLLDLKGDKLIDFNKRESRTLRLTVKGKDFIKELLTNAKPVKDNSVKLHGISAHHEITG